MTDTQQDFEFAARATLDGNRDEASTAEIVVRRLIDEGFSQGHLDVCDELIADDIVEHACGFAHDQRRRVPSR